MILPGWHFNNALRYFEEEGEIWSFCQFLNFSEAFQKCPGTGRLLLQELKIRIPETLAIPASFDSDFAQIGASKYSLHVV